MSRRQRALPLWLPWSLSGVGGLLLLTGALWLWVHYTTGAGAGPDALPHPAEAWALRVHGAGAFASLFLFGAAGVAHVPPAWRLSQRRGLRAQTWSGIGLCVLALALSLTGYLLYYFAPETVRPGLGGGHAGLGAAMALLLGWHRWRAGVLRRHGFSLRPENL